MRILTIWQVFKVKKRCTGRLMRLNQLVKFIDNLEGEVLELLDSLAVGKVDFEHGLVEDVCGHADLVVQLDAWQQLALVAVELVGVVLDLVGAVLPNGRDGVADLRQVVVDVLAEGDEQERAHDAHVPALESPTDEPGC